MSTALHDVITDEAGYQVENKLTAIQNKVEAAFEQLFGVIALSARYGVGTVVYNAVEHVLLDQIRTPYLERGLRNTFTSTSRPKKPLKHLPGRLPRTQ